MKKFLFTLAALFMAGTAMADSGFFFGTLDESTIGSTNESSLVLTQEDLQMEEYEMNLCAYWSARVSGTECEVTYPEGMTITFAEPGADATVNTLNARGRAATETAAFAGLAEPYNHFVTTFSTAGYYKDEDGNIVNYGVNKWEAGLYEEMGIFYVVFDPNFQGGDIIVKTTVASGKDERGGTVRENGEHAKAFTFTCHVTVEGGVTPDPVVAPEPTLTWNEETFTMEATCEGHEVVLMIGDEVVANPYTVEQTEEEQTITFKAYTVAAAGEDENSAAVEQEVVVPAKEVVIPDLPGQIIIGAPAANGEFYVNYMTGDYEGDYEIVVTINGETVEANENGTYQAVEGENHVVVTVVANGYNDKVAENTFNYHYPTTAPAPEFVWNEETFTMEAVCEGHTVVLYMNGTEVENPYTVEQTEEEQTIVFSAMTVAADEDNNSAVAYAEPVVVPAKEVVVTPPAMPTYEVTYDDDFMYITFACEEGAELTIYDEDGQEVAENPVKIARPAYDEAADPVYVRFSATATVDGVVSETLYVNEKVEQKAQEVTPEDPHAKGWWIVLTDINGEEVWYELHEGTDGSWVTTVTLNYGDYGTFYWDPELSAAENNLNRPNVPYHFVVDGQVWGAPEADQATLMGEAANTMSNPLYENANNYTVPVGYSYVLGIYVDPSTEDQLGDGTFYYVYCAQGPQTDVDELNAAKTVAGVRYFNLAGQEMQEANGMTIVVTTYTDGTTSAVKVMK